MVNGTAAAAAIAQAIKASGAIIRVGPDSFLQIVGRSEIPVVVRAEGGIFSKHYQYLTSYKGFVFFAKSPKELMFPGPVEMIEAQRIWIPY